MSLKKIFNKFFKSSKEYKEFKLKKFRRERLDLFDRKYKNIIEDIGNKISKKKELNFLHSGHCGDLIYSLAVIQKLSETHTCNFYVGLNKKIFPKYEKHPSGDVFINDHMMNLILPLLKSQKYLNIVKKHESEDIDINLDLFRELPVSLHYNSPRWYFHITGEHVDLSKPYIHLNHQSGFESKILIHRTFRYRNDFINYNFLRNYDNLFFLGLDYEYNDLKKQIPNLKIYETKNFLEMAQAIKSAKFFIGNLSVAYPIAEAMKIPRLLEACPESPVVQPIGGDAYDFYYQPHFEKWFKYLLKKYQ